MSDEIIVQYASPTLAGIKTGSLFTCPYTDRRQTMLEIRSLNRKLVPKGLRVLPLRYSAERVLVYLYRPARLEKDLALFGSYGWGDGEWMRLWEDEAREAGANLVADGLMINGAPDDDGEADCKALGAALA